VYKIGIDVGGTFTDFVVARQGETPRYFKTPSTPADPSQAVMAGLQIAADAYGQPIHRFLEETELVEVVVDLAGGAGNLEAAGRPALLGISLWVHARPCFLNAALAG